MIILIVITVFWILLLTFYGISRYRWNRKLITLLKPRSPAECAFSTTQKDCTLKKQMDCTACKIAVKGISEELRQTLILKMELDDRNRQLIYILVIATISIASVVIPFLRKDNSPKVRSTILYRIEENKMSDSVNKYQIQIIKNNETF